MVEIVVSVAAKVSEYLVDPVVRQLGYLFNYRANIEDLSQQVEKLRDARARHQHSVDEAIGNGHKIQDDVCKWLTRAEGFLEDAGRFREEEKEAQKSCFNGLCPNLKSRYQLSREASKKAGVAVQILGDGQFGRVSYRVPLQEIGSSPSETLESRMLTLNDVMEALRDADINRIGVCGMGGVGKSTLVKQVAEQAEQDGLFRKVVMAPVFQTPDFRRIQGELADMLGMKFKEESERGRAARLHQRIKEEKTILIILDDLWAELELEKIGIPSPDDHKGCKLVLTSRNRHVLSNGMGTQKDFRVEDLEEDEAWILFKNIAGDSIQNPELYPIAFDVAKECAGLPIAIVTVAKALKNKSVSIWKDALQQLKSHTSENITGMETKVHSSLKLSYEHLGGDEVKSFFLLCGLFSDYIGIRDLLKYGMGLRLFKGTSTLEEAKNRIHSLVDNLKSSNLLLETDHNAIVTMHDHVRSTARRIAFEQHHVFTLQNTTVRVEEWPRIDELQKVTWVGLNYCDIHELPEGLVCSKLEFFRCFLETNSSVKIPNSFFEGMRQLKVLDFTTMHLPSLPSSLQCLANLRALCLDGCELGDIGTIAELKKLEILSLMASDIEQLPREIAQLTHLRLLDLSDSSKLKVIPPDVISSLFRLEDLCMENSFTQWEVEGKSNACLAELKQLSHLTALDIQIPDAKLLPKEIVLDNLMRYRIFVGDVWIWENNYKTSRTLKLNKFDTSLHLVDGISKLLKRTEDLHLRELCGGTNVLSKLNREGFLRLKHLNVESSPEIQYIANSMDLTSSHGAFPAMETLSLNQLINLQEVCHGQFPAGSFGRLRKVKVEDCDGLKCLFSLSVARGLSRLEKIKVTSCKSMVEMVSRGGKEKKEDAVNVPLFLELRYLTLQDLPKLSKFCFEENPVLSKAGSTIVGPSTPPLNQPEIRDGQLLLSLGGNLRSLTLKNCMSLLKLFPPSFLQNLQTLIVENCDHLEQVFDFDDRHVRVLHKLEELTLIGLPKLRHICNCGSSRNHFPSSMASAPVGNIIFPKLFRVSLESLPNLTSFSPAYHSVQRLHHADLDTPFPLVFDERVAFPCLEFLNISGLDNVKQIWHNQLPPDSFSKLKEVKVASCGELLNIFPSCMLKRLQSLRFLSAVDCSSLEEVFDVEEINANVNVNVNVKEGVTVTQLNQLILRLLPKVEKIWNKDPHGILNFQNLKLMFIEDCQSLKNLFPASLVRDLVQLEELEVRYCGIEEIVAQDNEVETVAKFIFPKVTSLTLFRLHQLRSFYPGAHTSQWPSLKDLRVDECDKVNVFGFETPTFQQRHYEGSSDMRILQPLFIVQQVAFPYLEALILDDNGNTEIWQEQFPVDFFPRLRNLVVCGYGDILVVIPSFMLQTLHNLEELNVKRCSSVKEVFQLEGLDEENQVQRLGRLRKICLRNLPELTHLWKENSKSGLDLQSLESLQVWNCDNLINLVPCSVSFQNLDTLDVWSCGSLRSLISPLVAKSLVKLKKLKIGGSHMMEEVVANEGRDATDEIAFCKLQDMVIQCLPNLTSFNSGGYIFSFPSLEHMVVEECPKMKIFSPNIVTTPKLERVEVADHEWHWQDDLNTTIHNLFMKTHGNVEVEIVELKAGSTL